MKNTRKKQLLATKHILKTESILIPSEGLVRLPQVLAMVPLAAGTVWERVRQGLFPKPYSIGGRAVAWDVNEVREAIEKMKAAPRPSEKSVVKARAALAQKYAQIKANG